MRAMQTSRTGIDDSTSLNGLLSKNRSLDAHHQSLDIALEQVTREWPIGTIIQAATKVAQHRIS